jgi:tripartite-type tricarboxylate transporter receptor subunit TctC
MIRACNNAFAAAIVAVAAANCAPAAFAQPSDLFRGKPITMIIGAGAGGGIDLYGRVVARHIGRHLPGQPAVVPQNMPAAGSIAAANHLYSIAPKDGTAIGIVSQGLILDEVLGTPGLRFEIAKFNWVGRVSSDVLVTYLWHAAKVKSVADAMAVEASLGGTGVGSSVSKSPLLLNQLIGTKFKMILGYTDTGASALAVERGEVDGTSTGWGGLASTKAEWIKSKKINLVVQYGTTRHPDLPDVPSWTDIAKTPDDARLLKLFGTNADIGKSIIAPPGIAPECVAALRQAFAAMLEDPAFLAEVKAANMDFDPASGEALQKIVLDAVSVPDALRERARSFAGSSTR